MPGMDRDSRGRTLGKYGGEAGHNRLVYDPPRNRTICFPQSINEFRWLEDAIVRAGYRVRADFVIAALEALRVLADDDPMPPHSTSATFNKMEGST